MEGPEQNDLSPDFKFNNCGFRSDREESKFIQTCKCTRPLEVKGFHCSIHDIFPLQSAFCMVCKDFQQK